MPCGKATAVCPSGIVPLSVHSQAVGMSPKQDQNQRKKAGFCFLSHWGKRNPSSQMLMSEVLWGHSSLHAGPDVCILQLLAEKAQLPPSVCMVSLDGETAWSKQCAGCSPIGQVHTARQAAGSGGPWGRSQKNDQSPPQELTGPPLSSKGR